VPNRYWVRAFGPGANVNSTFRMRRETDEQMHEGGVHTWVTLYPPKHENSAIGDPLPTAEFSNETATIPGSLPSALKHHENALDFSHWCRELNPRNVWLYTLIGLFGNRHTFTKTLFLGVCLPHPVKDLRRH
jgi:hypothetical protein